MGFPLQWGPAVKGGLERFPSSSQFVGHDGAKAGFAVCRSEVTWYVFVRLEISFDAVHVSKYGFPEVCPRALFMDSSHCILLHVSHPFCEGCLAVSESAASSPENCSSSDHATLFSPPSC